jgi:hypothetical protein
MHGRKHAASQPERRTTVAGLLVDSLIRLPLYELRKSSSSKLWAVSAYFGQIPDLPERPGPSPPTKTVCACPCSKVVDQWPISTSFQPIQRATRSGWGPSSAHQISSPYRIHRLQDTAHQSAISDGSNALQK